MKVAVGSQPYDGPWGGGNRFVASLCEGLQTAGHEVVHDLDHADIDIALMMDPRVRSPNVTFGAGALFRHITFRSPHTIVVHRVNECDERKGEPFINAKLVRANYVADATTFVGSWLKELPVWRANLREPSFVVLNGADTATFNTNAYRPWNGIEPLRLVTHHWGYHPNKGFDIYRQLDDMLGDPTWRNRINFTYVGNLPRGFAFRNARYVEPLDGAPLAEEIGSHHVYVTGSINEPGGNHQNEGALCGLPLIYRNSGCMPEYCAGFGVEFQGLADFPAKLNELISRYGELQERMATYPHTASKMVENWVELLASLDARRAELLERRKQWRTMLRSLQLAAAL